MESCEKINNTIQKEDLIKELKKFNWAAFGISFIWAIFNGAWQYYWPLFVICAVSAVLGFFFPFLKIIVLLINLIISIYIGVNGNCWAYKSSKWDNLDDFIFVQKVWAIAYLAIIIIFFVMGVLMYFIANQ